jgi:molybdopterin synthase sulfur carrier subunit
VLCDGGTLRSAVQVHVRLGAGLATAAGTRRLSLALPKGATVDTLFDRLAELEPGIAAGLGSALPVVRGTHAGRGQELSDGDEVALLMPVAGGSAGRTQFERRQQWQ